MFFGHATFKYSASACEHICSWKLKLQILCMLEYISLYVDSRKKSLTQMFFLNQIKSYPENLIWVLMVDKFGID